ncbi:MAG TPA: efflux transporter outer membrane subunit [Terricaulis sp.]|nr:efflux transporter outer membrane subunit [Terricaulis sp.]
MMRRVLLSFSAALALSACAVLEPGYDRPALPTPDAWPDSAAAAETASEAAMPEWRAFFADEKLSALIEIAIENNRDLRVAALNIERARSQYRIQRAQSVPGVSAVGQGDISGVTPGGQGGDIVDRQYSAGLGITNFELDLFGRVRGLNRAALQRYFATADARDSVQISLIAEVANAYLTYAGDLELLRLAQDTFQSQDESLSLTQQRFDAGAASALDLNRARTTVETARADFARYTAQVARDENALALLLGAPVPEALRPTSIADVRFGVEELPAGLPSDVLLNRPDIRGAEHSLRAANANIGAARAAFFPRITLTGFAGEADPQFENLFTGVSNQIWTFTPQVSVPIFQGGALLSQLGVANTDRDIAVAQYERAIQVAFREVADALATRAAIGEELAARQRLADASSESFTLSEARYREGVDNYLSLLDAQRSNYGAQQSLVAARVARATNFVTLYKTLGGGER